MYNIKVIEKGCEVTLLLSSAVCVLCLLWYSIQNKDLLEILPFLSNNSQKLGNMRTGTEIVNPCVV